MEKKAFLTKQQAEKIAETYPTPWHIYDEKGIRENAAKVQQAFAWNPGFREYFAVKATPNPFLLDILKEYGCGTDCSSMTDLPMTLRLRNLLMRTGSAPSSTSTTSPTSTWWSRCWESCPRP